jgi:hypothetical protein
MLDLHQSTLGPIGDRISRREWLRVGGLGIPSLYPRGRLAWSFGSIGLFTANLALFKT